MAHESLPVRQNPKRAVAAVVAAALVLVAFIAGRATAPGGLAAPLPTHTATPSASLSRPRPEEHKGFADTREGAVQAATHFARVTSTISGDFEEFVASAVEVAAPSWKTEARRLAENGVDFILERYGSTGSATFVPVRYRVVSFSRERAVVAVWGVTLAMGGKVAGIDESWVTGTFELARVNSDWRLAGGDSEAGPTPQLLQTGTPLPTSALSSFEEYVSVPPP